MLVLFTGMVRSGSTWTYNVTRILLMAGGATVLGEYRDDIEAALAAADDTVGHHLIKTHAPDALGRAMIGQRRCRTVCTYRNPLDCVASQMESFGASFEEAVSSVHDGLVFLREQAAVGGVLFVDYADVVDRPSEVVGAIARHLDRPISAGDAASIAAHFSKDAVARFTARFKNHVVGEIGRSEAWDSITLFYSGHIRARPSAPEALLSAEQLGVAHARLRDFLDADGRLAADLADALAPRVGA